MALNHHLSLANISITSTTRSTSFRKPQQLLSFPLSHRDIFPAKPSSHQLLCIAGYGGGAASAVDKTSLVDAPTHEDRRSGGYMQSIWRHDVLENLSNNCQGHDFLKRVETLKEGVRKLLQNEAKGQVVSLLQLVDDIQRLGLEYHFKEDISIALDAIKNVKIDDNDLYATSLHFRIFRQHGFKVSQDVFACFKDPKGKYMEKLKDNIKALVSLYEASFLGTVGEDNMDEAKVFARRHLMDVKRIDSNHSKLVNHALQLPLHLNVVMLEARWYIDAYSRRNDANIYLLELAKLDYNIIQAGYQKEAVDISSWWKKLGLIKPMPFARDTVIECFFGSMGTTYEPQYKYCREGIAKLISFINTIDDVYDVYATLDEAILFTEAVERWDVNGTKALPESLQLCFFALHNTINEIAYNTHKETGINVTSFLQKTWVDLCKSYLQEAKWFHTGYKPTLEEYLSNGFVSVSGPMLLMHIYVMMCPNITLEALDYLASTPNIVYCLGMILRLVDDMGTYKVESNRGDVPKSIACCMHDLGVTEEAALEYLRHFTDEIWKKMNIELWIESPLPKPFIEAVFNLARTTESTYQHRNGNFDSDHLEEQISTLLVDNVPIM